jgi:hypothetical protein
MAASILSSSPRPVLPAVAWSAYRIVNSRGPSGIDRTELRDLLLPIPLREDHGRAESVEAAVSLLVDARLVHELKGLVTANEDIRNVVTEREFRRTLRTRLLAPDANSDLLASDEGPRELTKGIAWILCQKIDEPFEGYDAAMAKGGTAVRSLNAQFSDEKRQLILRSSNRWNPFLRWARYLGFIEPTPRRDGGVMPDPTAAIRDVLSDVSARTGKKAPITAVVGVLAELLPVLDEGGYRLAVEREMTVPPPSVATAGSYSHSLSYALRRLHEEGSITLINEDDAPLTRSLPLLAADRFPISHVALNGGGA